MRFGRCLFFSAVALSIAVPAFATPRSRRGPASSHLFGKRNAHPGTKTATPQRAIDTERTTQIQNALIKQGYLTGEPSGKWDNDTQAALQKLQGENGWQTKLVPDSRAIIKLGLGPNTDHPQSDNTGISPSDSSSGESTQSTQ